MVTSVAIREFLHSLGDTAATGSQKVYTVPAGEVWEVLSVNVNLLASATAGNRRVVCIARPPTAFEVARGSSPVTQAASEYRTYNFGTGFTDQAAFIANYINMSMPRIILAENWQIETWDVAQIDPTGDTMDVRIAYLKRFVGEVNL